MKYAAAALPGLATCLIASPDAEIASPPWPDEIDFAITALE
jgi:hypothetical protein